MNLWHAFVARLKRALYKYLLHSAALLGSEIHRAALLVGVLDELD
jgi:hypothetical protein